MIRIPTQEEKERFEALCRKHSVYEVRGGEFDGIGIYNEKRLHRILKEFVCENEECFEVKLGGSVADVFCDGVITEVQTAGFYPLKKKISAYLGSTEHSVRVVHPIISEKTVVRVDPVTGEIMRSRRSSKKEKVQSVLPELIYLSEHLRSPRLSFEIYCVRAEEHRYSDEVHRYRKSGKRDSELFPVSLESVSVIKGVDDLIALLPDELKISGREFTAAQFSRLMGIKGRKAYNALGALCAAGVLKREKNGTQAAVYKVEG